MARARGLGEINIGDDVIVEVAHNLMTQVKYAVERMIGMAVESVDVNIQSIKVSR